MPANRGLVALVALVALAVLVWSVAFAGGATVAVLSAGVDVTTTFETPEELSEVNESSGSGFAVATAPVENGTTAVGENGTSAAANGTETVGNTTVPPTEQNATVPPTDQNDSTPATNETETDQNDSTPATNETETDQNDSTPAGNATVEGSTAPDANDVDAVAVRHPPDPSRSGQGART
ncbi:hypothetical protein C465_14606 [Halorubrum distributum JCM 9100]|uniref:Uncharacterized protein n=2 Tax=Halorubrum distributum TaxID=29283 RepID=M0EDN0_9EURY|nr:hypothetical protein [Halorubrum distributum]ELZ45163.1 hypothetical protein C465_14606 [Halorubrum distributum JCM 9100]ELZ50908.1 hypothetical protein C466_14571 [Halorubrum distributum JCM 10118]